MAGVHCAPPSRHQRLLCVPGRPGRDRKATTLGAGLRHHASSLSWRRTSQDVLRQARVDWYVRQVLQSILAGNPAKPIVEWRDAITSLPPSDDDSEDEAGGARPWGRAHSPCRRCTLSHLRSFISAHACVVVGDDMGGYKGFGWATTVELLSTAFQSGPFGEDVCGNKL